MPNDIGDDRSTKQKSTQKHQRSTAAPATKSRGRTGRPAVGDRLTIGKKTPRTSAAVPTAPKGLWLFHPDAMIGVYASTPTWEARPIAPDVEYGNKSGFESVLRQVRAYHRKMKRPIPRLAIVVHGKLRGIVQFRNPSKNRPASVPADREDYRYMSPHTIYYFRHEIAELGKYLTADAQVAFFSCLAGEGPQGAYLLKRFSSYLPGRTIVGFTTIGLSGSSRSTAVGKKPAGVIYDSGDVYPLKGGKPEAPKRRYVSSPYAKHAKNGKITKPATLPASELTRASYQPTRRVYVRRNPFDFLNQDRELYYLSVLVLGWEKFDRRASRSRHAGDDFRDAKKLIVKDKRFIELRDKGLPKDRRLVDGVQLVHRTKIPVGLWPMSKAQIIVYRKLQATLRPRFRRDVAVIWRNNLQNRKRIDAHVDAMLALSRGRKPPRHVIKTLGARYISSVFLPPRRR